MDTRLVARSPQIIVLATLLILMISSLFVFLLLIYELSAPMWSRPAIFLQLLALAMAIVATPLLPAKRLLLHPVLAAGTIYLWDMSLPPPTLSHEFARTYLPLGMIALIVADGTLLLWQTARKLTDTAPRTSPGRTNGRPLPGHRLHQAASPRTRANGHHHTPQRGSARQQPAALPERPGPEHVDELLPHVTESSFLNALIASGLASLALALPALFLLILAALFL